MILASQWELACTPICVDPLLILDTVDIDGNFSAGYPLPAVDPGCTEEALHMGSW